MTSSFNGRLHNRILNEITHFGGFSFSILIFFIFLFTKSALFLPYVYGQIIFYLVTPLLRLTFFRERPNKVEYKTIIQKIFAGSFPSLHTARIFFVTILLFTISIEFGLLSLIIAFSVGCSRVYLRRHHTIDVIVGALFGIIVGVLLLI